MMETMRTSWGIRLDKDVNRLHVANNKPPLGVAAGVIASLLQKQIYRICLRILLFGWQGGVGAVLAVLVVVAVHRAAHPHAQPHPAIHKKS